MHIVSNIVVGALMVHNDTDAGFCVWWDDAEKTRQWRAYPKSRVTFWETESHRVGHRFGGLKSTGVVFGDGIGGMRWNFTPSTEQR